MALAAGSGRLQFERTVELGTLGQFDLETVTHEAAVDPADRIVRSALDQIRLQPTPSAQALGIATHIDAGRRAPFSSALPLSTASTERTGDKRLDALRQRLSGRRRARSRSSARRSV